MKHITTAEYHRHFQKDISNHTASCLLFLAEAADYSLPVRDVDSHKYSYGRALIIAGSKGFSGAPVLAANACERSGAGLTQLVVPDTIYMAAASRCDGAVVTPVPATPQGAMSSEALETILPMLARADACVIGPGIGTGEGSEELVSSVIRNADCPLVLDADALTVCGKNTGLFNEARVPLILTPHEGEFKRIGGDLSSGRLTGALKFASEYRKLILVLKGFGSLIAQGGEIVVNPTGGPAMAKGGSGDVLCGILCALMAQGFEPLFSARCGVYLHGLAGDLACREKGEYSVTPSDLIEFLPKAFKSMIRAEKP